MTEYNWALIRDEAINTWGTIPQGQLEADILEVFEQTPALVIATIDKTTTAWRAGKITSPWAILRLELQKASSPDRAPIVTDKRARDKAIEHAEQWIRATGIHYPTETEMLNHLFGIEETTPPLEYLEQLELDTKGNPGRALYAGLLKAAINKTREDGPQPIPGTGNGPLSPWRTTAIRDRMTALWREERPRGIQAETEPVERANAWKTQHAAAAKGAAT